MILLSVTALLLRIAKWICAVLTALAAGHMYMLFRDGIDFRSALEAQRQIQAIFGVYLPFKAVEVLIAAFEAVPMFLLLGLTTMFRWSEHRVVQWNEDLSVRGLVDLLRRGIRRPFVLYLRPFDTTNAIVAPNPTPQLPLPMVPTEAVRDSGFELEQTIKAAVGRHWKFVALGRPGEHVGAARIKTSEEEWKRTFIELAQGAKLIVCMPGANEGTRWEINHLKSTYQLEKSVFVMPPATRGFNASSAWQMAREALANDGVELPPYNEEGAAFMIERSGQVLKSLDVDFAKPRTLRAAFRRVAHASVVEVT